MIIDSSAIMAILEREPGWERVLDLAARSRCRMSAANWAEVGIVADRRSTSHGARLDEVLAELEVVVEPVSARQAEVARLAYRRFGRGSGSKAQLNFGDCFAYALAVTAAEPLLFTGNDFTHTDIAPAINHDRRARRDSNPQPSDP